jgi:D-methionine transport system substrate-binding protein
MVFISSALGILGGGLLGILLFVTLEPQFSKNKFVHQSVGAVVNLIRSIPFIILLISIVPLTRLIVGTSIGTNAAIVPLVLAAIPFYARICEAALATVPKGLIEVGHAMGASQRRIIAKILLPESSAALVKGAALTIIGLIGYSTMAGAIGGGGLGELAINYGYQRFDGWVMLETIVVLLLIVQGVQSLADTLIKRRKIKLALWLCIPFALICILSQIGSYFMTSKNVLRVGVMSGSSQEIMAVAAEEAKDKYGLILKIVPFSDYMQPNMALDNGDIDANIFQHKPFLDAQIQARHYAIIDIAKTFVYPFGFYSLKIKNISELKPGAIIALPNDPSNEGRALMLLQSAHLIQLAPGVTLLATVRDIAINPKHLKFKLLDGAQLPRVLKDADLVGINNDFLVPAGLSAQAAVLLEGRDSPYANLIVVRKNDVNNPQMKELVAVMHSKAVVDITGKEFNGGAVPAW